MRIRLNKKAHKALMEDFKKSMKEYVHELSDTELADIATLEREDVIRVANKIQEVVIGLQTGNFNSINVEIFETVNNEAVEFALWALFNKLEMNNDEVAYDILHSRRPFIPRVVR